MSTWIGVAGPQREPAHPGRVPGCRRGTAGDVGGIGTADQHPRGTLLADVIPDLNQTPARTAPHVSELR